MALLGGGGRASFMWHTQRSAPLQKAHTARSRLVGMRLASGSASVVLEIAQQVASKQRSAVEVTTAYLQQLRSVEDRLGSFLSVDEQHALAQVVRVFFGAGARCLCLRPAMLFAIQSLHQRAESR